MLIGHFTVRELLDQLSRNAWCNELASSVIQVNVRHTLPVRVATGFRCVLLVTTGAVDIYFRVLKGLTASMRAVSASVRGGGSSTKWGMNVSGTS